jgi:L-seryl-tRNA(Ser) seleniumtransferase
VDAWVELLHEQGVAAERVNSEAAIGGGTLAEAPVSSVALRISGTDPDQLAQRLRSGSPALIGRVVEGALLVDARSVFPEQDPLVAQALRRACGN